LTAWLGAGARYVAQLEPDLALRLGDSAALAAASAGAIQSETARFSLFQATASFLRRAGTGQPLLLVLEDIHAADDPSLLLLRYLVRDLRSSQVLVVATYRDAEVARLPGLADAVGELVRDGQLTTLRGLSGGDVQALIGDLIGAAPSEGLVQAVQETTEGNPLFVREAVRLLASSGLLDRPGRPGVPIPGSVRALIQQRLAPLSADAIQVLSVAAVVGRDFDLSVVTPSCALPPERVLGAVSEAVALGVVVDEPTTPGRYRFSHSLMREVTYEALPIPVRAGLHQAVGEAIERAYGADADGHLAELSRHFAEAAGSAGAGDGARDARALTYARRAGDRAMQAHAYEDAAAEYQRALHALEVGGQAVADELGGQADDDEAGTRTADDEPGTRAPTDQAAAGSVDALRCELLLQLGAAQVRAGRYAEARAMHLQAAEIARRLGAPDKLARAALGFGEPHVEGGHVNRQLVALLREALDASPRDGTSDGAGTGVGPLPARLRARLSVELTFSEEAHLSDGLSREAVDLARRLGDARALGDALDARWMAVWGPDGLPERAALAEETLHMAQSTDDRDLDLRGRVQRIACSLEAGDFLAVEADIATYARLSDDLRMPVHQWTLTTMRAMRALLLGAFEEAERLTGEAFAAQPERPSARWAHLLELTLIRWEQGRLLDLHETWRGQVERFPRLAIARAWLALADLERGDRESAARAVQILAERLPGLTRTGLWLPGAVLAALATSRVGDADAARALYDALRPYAGHTGSMNMEQPVLCFGSGAFYLGLLATVTGDWTAAERHFEAAIQAHERLGAAPLLARARVELARVLLRRGEPADRERAHALLARAEATVQALGLAELGGQIAALATAGAAEAAAPQAGEPATAGGPETAAPPAARPLAAPPDPATTTAPTTAPGPASLTPTPAPAPPPAAAPVPASPPTPAADRFQRQGELWTVSFDGTVVHLKDSKGLRQLAHLLGQPGRELHVTDLEALVNGAAEPASSGRPRDAGHGELGLRSDMGDAGEILDAEARAAYKARLDELQEEIDEAEDFNDSERAERARSEREFLIRELARAVGLGGRDRKAASHAERARLNATRAIRSAMGSIAKAHPALGEHLAATIRTGRYCSYTPDPRSPVSWQL
jgi:tetratricopeptide (TPR) repeat protein